ncbi:hypothetical protein H2203_006410 [Taxawa tesnikishii (nom. ined.)]|nr:hypothetical protein H2203_006410 [Dothideales sp. JES 119]
MAGPPPPVPLVLCGKNPSLATSFVDALNNTEYDVIHVCHDLQTAKSEIPALLRGQPVPNPSSHLSKLPNKDNPIVPKAVVIGKGFSEEEMDDIIATGRREEKEGSGVLWLKPDDEKITMAMKAKMVLSAGTMIAPMVADRVRQTLKERGVVPGAEGKVEGGVVGF